MTIKGTRAEIAEVIKAISTTYPVSLIKSLEPGTVHFIMSGVDVRVIIEDDKPV